MKAAVAIGGSSALAACLDRDGANIPTGTATQLPERQHAWDEFAATDDYGNHRLPRHHVLLYLDYTSDGVPSESDREQTEAAFAALEEAFAWSNNGLLFTVSYSPAYFNRFDESLPESVNLPSPEPLAPFEEPELDTSDAVVRLSSDHAKAVLAAEEALRGNQEEVNGVEIEENLVGVFEVADRRTGFVGAGLPAKHDDVDGVPEGEVSEDAPLFMGFKSGFKKNQASEDLVTIDEGPFAGGTTQHISLLRSHLDQWYDQDSREQRVAKMFCPYHAENDMVEGVGDNLGDSAQITENGCAERTEEDAFEKGVVGHSQKTARTRKDGNPLILRRDFDTTDGDHTGLHFVSLHRTISDFAKTREAMNGTDVAGTGAVGEKNNNGILQYVTTERRGNFLIPPRSKRSLPKPSTSDQ